MTAPIPLTPEARLRECLEYQDEVVLSGCAGTGKTWQVQRLVDEGVVLCAPTAKAAERLKTVCQHEAITVHSLIYGAPKTVWIKDDGNPCKGGWFVGDQEVDPDVANAVQFQPNVDDSQTCPGCTCRQELRFGSAKGLDGATRLIVVDEASMVGTKLAADIREAVNKVREQRTSTADGVDYQTWQTSEREQPIQILWVGDPMQLPPVNDDPGVDLAHPDVHLDKVWRADGDILALATEIREAQSFAELAAALARPRHQMVTIGVGGRPVEVPAVDIQTDGLGGLATWRAGKSQRMAIVHSNRQRIEANVWVRQILKRQGPLVTGDRVIIRKNARQIPVWNGEIYVVEKAIPVDGFTVLHARLDGVKDAPTIRLVVDEKYLTAKSSEDQARDARALSNRFQPLAAVNHHDTCTFYTGIGNDCGPDCRPGPLSGLQLVNAQHGFVITCHAAQGSEADEVGVLWTPYSHRDDIAAARSWLYTACTRARLALTIWTGR